MSKTKLVWTASAITELQRIYQYYEDIAGTNTARKIKSNIITCTTILKTHPLAGQEE